MTEERSAWKTLDDIAAGGRQLVAIVLDRLRETEKALSEGRFIDALARANELAGRLAPLAGAEQAISHYAYCVMVRAGEATEGMVLYGFGRVSKIEREDHPIPGSGGELCQHVALHLEGQEDPYRCMADQELVFGVDGPDVPG